MAIRPPMFPNMTFVPMAMLRLVSLTTTAEACPFAKGPSAKQLMAARNDAA